MFGGVGGCCLLVVGFVGIVVTGIVIGIVVVVTGRSCWRRGGGSTCYAW